LSRHFEITIEFYINTILNNIHIQEYVDIYDANINLKYKHTSPDTYRGQQSTPCNPCTRQMWRSKTIVIYVLCAPSNGNKTPVKDLMVSDVGLNIKLRFAINHQQHIFIPPYNEIRSSD